MKRSIALLVVLILGIFLVAGCGGGGGGDALKGTWTGKLEMDTDWIVDITWVFDGKGGLKFSNGFFDKEPGKYTISEGGKVELKVDGWDDPVMYNFTVDGKKLTLTSDNGWSPNYELTKK